MQIKTIFFPDPRLRQPLVTLAEKRDICNTTAPTGGTVSSTRDDKNFEFCNEFIKNDSVVGRLKKNKLHASNFVQKIIHEGYVIPFES